MVRTIDSMARWRDVRMMAATRSYGLWLRCGGNDAAKRKDPAKIVHTQPHSISTFQGDVDVSRDR